MEKSVLLPDLLFSSNQWLVLAKPAGWLTIPGRESPVSKVSVVSSWAAKQFGSVYVVHRLDRDTSGVLLFARTPEAHREANLWFQNRKMSKVYLCLASGEPSLPVFKIQTPIRDNPSMTQVEVRESLGNCFLARIMPVTGRRHQIRIHLSSRGFPILGDLEYGGPPSVLGGAAAEVSISRVALHAAQLTLPSGETFTAELPPDFTSWLTQLRGQS